MPVRLIELFAGVGGFRLGLEQALGREHVRTVYANDNSRLACEWYQRWHGDTPDCCDVRTVERLPDCDVLCAGFPCQTFSRAGLQLGVRDRKGQLFDVNYDYPESMKGVPSEFRRAIIADPKNAMAHINLGVILERALSLPLGPRRDVSSIQPVRHSTRYL